MLITFNQISVDICEAITGINTSCLLLYLNLRKIEDPFNHHTPTSTHPPTHPENKGFRYFEKGRFTLVFLNTEFSSPVAYKLERPLGGPNRESVFAPSLGRMLITLDEGLLDEFGGLFWMLQFLDLFVAEI